MYILTAADLFPGTVNKILSRLLILLAVSSLASDLLLSKPCHLSDVLNRQLIRASLHA